MIRSIPLVALVSLFIELIVLGSSGERAWAHGEEEHPHPGDPSKPPGELHPYFAGSLMSLPGRTAPPGMVAARAFWFHNRYGGLYTDSWRFQSTDTTSKNHQGTFLAFGLTDAMDLVVIPQWIGRHDEHDDFVKFADLPVTLGFQALKPPDGSWLPSIRVLVQQVFPTGSYQQLTPRLIGAAGSGGGSYATSVGVSMEEAFHLSEVHFLRFRFNALYSMFLPVDVEGFNSYGGGFGTKGRVEPGTVTTLNLTTELSLTRHIAVALDLQYQSANATLYFGTPGVTLTGEPARIGSGYNSVFIVAPALEYNHNEHLGFVFGVSTSVAGRNRPQFFGLVALVQVSFNLFK